MRRSEVQYREGEKSPYGKSFVGVVSDEK